MRLPSASVRSFLVERGDSIVDELVVVEVFAAGVTAASGGRLRGLDGAALAQHH